MTIDAKPNREEDKNKGVRLFGQSRKRIAASVAAALLSIALIAAACSGGEGHEGSREGAGEHTGGGESGEGSGEHSGGGEGAGEHTGGGESGEGSGEHAGEGEGHEGDESGEDTSPTLPVSEPTSGTFNNLDYRASYDPSDNSFKATVTNNTNQTVCASRVEVHMATQGQVTELGPTPSVDLQPGESVDVVLPADPGVPDTYTIHPESSPCP